MAYSTFDDNGETDWVLFYAGAGSMFVSGDFNGGTVTVEIKGRDGEPRTLPGFEFITDSSQGINLGSSRELRLKLVDATSPEIYWELDPMFNYNASSGPVPNLG